MKGGRKIRYVYRPSHPWRHGYRRNMCRRLAIWGVRVLFLLEVLWFAVAYVKSHTREEEYRIRTEEKGSQEEGNHPDDEVFGVGIEKGSGTIFWFHEKTKEDE